MIYVVTGGAGFIGSNIVAEIERRELGPVAIVDGMEREGQWLNVAKRTNIMAIVPPRGLIDFLASCPEDTALIHMGARTSTRDNDVAALVQNNSMLTAQLFEIAGRRGWPFVYASSASAYGTDSNQSDDDRSLRPVNPYGWSKSAGDRMVLMQAMTDPTPPIWAGLRFFNVYGKGEDHKGDDRSFVTKCFDAIRLDTPIKLFRGSSGYHRDWVYVDDCARLAVDIVQEIGHRIKQEAPLQGIFNVGTGEATSFVEVTQACIRAAEKPVSVATVGFPDDLRGRYQAFTKADTSKLRAALPGFEFMDLKNGLRRYWLESASKDTTDRYP